MKLSEFKKYQLENTDKVFGGITINYKTSLHQLIYWL